MDLVNISCTGRQSSQNSELSIYILNIEEQQSSDQKLSQMSIDLLVLSNAGLLESLGKVMSVIADHLTTNVFFKVFGYELIK